MLQEQVRIFFISCAIFGLFTGVGFLLVELKHIKTKKHLSRMIIFALVTAPLVGALTPPLGVVAIPIIIWHLWRRFVDQLPTPL